MDFIKSIFSEQRGRVFTVFLIIATIGVIGTVVYITSQQQFLAKLPAASNSSPASIANKQSHLDQDKQEIAQETKKSTQQQATSQQNSSNRSSANSQPPVPNNPPLSEPFTINSAWLKETQLVCSSGTVVMYVGSAQVIASSNVGGTFIWQIETANAYSPPAPYPTSATLAKYQTIYNIPALGSPGDFYTATNVHDGQSVRIHVTSPNDIASSWFTVPAGTQASCANS